MDYTVIGATGNLGSRIVKELTNVVDAKDIFALVHTLSKAEELSMQGISVR